MKTSTKEKKAEDSSGRKYTRPSKVRKYKRVLDKLVENGGNLRGAIREAGGFSPSVMNDPSKLTNTKTWQEVMAEEFPDEAVAQKHKQLLRSGHIEKLEFKVTDSDEVIGAYIANLPGYKLLRIQDHYGDKKSEIPTARTAEVFVPDALAQDRALDKVYKIKGRYMDEPVPGGGTRNTYNFIFSQPVQEQVKAMEENLKRLMIGKHDQASQEPVDVKPVQAKDAEIVHPPAK